LYAGVAEPQRDLSDVMRCLEGVHGARMAQQEIRLVVIDGTRAAATVAYFASPHYS
jgi:hypothetical protein